jgi:hypothetical protein
MLLIEFYNGESDMSKNVPDDMKKEFLRTVWCRAYGETSSTQESKPEAGTQKAAAA